MRDVCLDLQALRKGKFNSAMKLVAFTIVLDGEPFIERHLPVFHQLTIPWQWIVVEGAAGNTADTAWCKEQEPRLSLDGTHEYLSLLHGTIHHIWSEDLWLNKTDMCNAALACIHEPCVLMQIDADEIWTAEQLEKIVTLFEEHPTLAAARFACRYFVGPALLLQGEHCYGDFDNEWLRAWRFTPGDTFAAHEPPLLRQGSWPHERYDSLQKDESRKLGLVFDHFPYVTEAQVAYKEKFYGYTGLLDQWKALQRNQEWPVPLSRFFAHVSGDLPLVVKA